MPSSELIVVGLVALLSFGLSFLGASVGLVFGQLRLPILVYWLGSPTVGAATSMAISAAAALVGAARHARGGRVEARLMLTIGLPSAAAAWASTYVAPGLDPALVKLCIGITLIVTGLVMLWALARPPRRAEPSEPRAASAEGPSDRGPPSSTTTERRPHVAAEIGVGASLGAVAGVVGLLLGTLRLPAMMRLGVHPAKVVGTNLAVGAATGLFASTAAIYDGTVDMLAFGVITPATMLGAFWGASATGKLDKTTLRRLIAWSLLGVGLWMAAEPWW